MVPHGPKGVLLARRRLGVYGLLCSEYSEYRASVTEGSHSDPIEPRLKIGPFFALFRGEPGFRGSIGRHSRVSKWVIWGPRHTRLVPG